VEEVLIERLLSCSSFETSSDWNSLDFSWIFLFPISFVT
jgi:hypothetical protein